MQKNLFKDFESYSTVKLKKIMPKWCETPAVQQMYRVMQDGVSHL